MWLTASSTPRTSFAASSLALRQEADLDPRLRTRLAFEFPVDAGHDPEQRGFTGAVQAQHADLRAGKETERDIAKDDRLGGTTLPTRFMV